MREALAGQGRACARFGSAFSAALLERAAQAAGATPALDRLLSPWDGMSTDELFAAAVPLRLLGALHELTLTGEAPALTAAYPAAERPGDADAAWAEALEELASQEQRLAAFMAHEPQTNEVRRSAALLGGFLTIARETGLPLRTFELGASAGLNLVFDAFAYRLGEIGSWGDQGSGLTLETSWRGPPPPLEAALRVVARAACDRRPARLADEAARHRLRAYIWPDQAERLAAFEAAVAIARTKGVTVEAADAADFVASRAAPQPGLATIVYHSIVWQYLGPESQAALLAAIEAQGGRASAEAPFAWLRLEPAAGAPFPIELRATFWPGGEQRLLARAHPHGAWVEWLG